VIQWDNIILLCECKNCLEIIQMRRNLNRISMKVQTVFSDCRKTPGPIILRILMVLSTYRFRCDFIFLKIYTSLMLQTGALHP
jgi:hypothetical protein